MGTNEAGESDQSGPRVSGGSLPFSPLHPHGSQPRGLSCLKGQGRKGPYADLDCTDQRGI